MRMRLLSLVACVAFPVFGGCILVYDPDDFQIADETTGGTGGTGGDGTGGDGTGGGAGGGAGGGGMMCVPVGAGNPVEGLVDGEWKWVDVPEAKCRDNSETGFGIRTKQGSKNLVIFFDGLGSCFNGLSCNDSEASKPPFGQPQFDQRTLEFGNVGLFNPTNTENPVKDWNFVYIPYCTGDVHAGSNEDGDVPNGPQNQKFVGYANVGHYMKRIVPTFPGMEKVLVTGISAGGFGAFFNYDRIARDFCPASVILIDDSGPPMSDTYLAPCLQDRMRMLWGLNANLPVDCPGANTSIVELVKCLGTKYANGRLGIIASNEDARNRVFYGFGQNTCALLDSTMPSQMTAAMYSTGLLALRDNYMMSPSPWGSFFVNSTEHVFLADTFYSTAVGPKTLTSWMKDMVNGGPIEHVGP